MICGIGYSDSSSKISMGLSEADKRRVLEMLDQLNEGNKNQVLASLEAFGQWLYNASYSVYCKVKDRLRRLWRSICNLFR